LLTLNVFRWIDNKAAKEKKPENYMLSLEELRESDFPIPRYLDSNVPDLQPGWSETPKLPKTSLTPPPKIMIAMDCEMVRTVDYFGRPAYCVLYAASFLFCSWLADNCTCDIAFTNNSVELPLGQS